MCKQELTLMCDYCKGEKQLELYLANASTPTLSDCPKCNATGILSMSLEDIKKLRDSIEFGEWNSFETITLDINEAKFLVLHALKQVEKPLANAGKEAKNA